MILSDQDKHSKAVPLRASVVFRHNNKRTEDKLKEFTSNMGSSGNLMVDSDICWNENYAQLVHV